MASKRLVVIDGYSLLYRAFFATRYLSTSDGRPTNALYGFTQMLFLLLDQVKPDAIVVALDAPGQTFRHVEYPEYKATRKETADELKVQLVAARELIAALGIPTVECPGYEADDVVGTISRQGKENGYETTIVTGDLDSLQLVDDHVSVLTLKTGVTDTLTYGPEEVKARYGFGPEFVPDFKALKGDASDNIPGVPGIGDKGAADLITRFGTIEEIIDRFQEIDPKYQKKIDGNQEQMIASKRLATIVRDAPIEYGFDPFVISPSQLEAAVAFLEAYEMKSLARRAPNVLSRYMDGASREDPIVEVQAEAIEPVVRSASDQAGVEEWLSQGRMALYLPAPPPRSDLFEEEKRTALLACGRKVAEVPEDLALDWLRAEPERFTLHDAKPLYKRLGSWLDAPGFDTALAGFVLQSGRSSYALRDLVSGYLDVAAPQTAADLAVCLSLLEAPLRDRLEKEGQTRVLMEIEMPLIPILAEMERYGIQADRDALREFSKTLQASIQQTQSRIFEMAGTEFLIASPKQLGEVLFEKLGIPAGKKTKTGWATGAEVLEPLALDYEIVAEVLHWRELSKLKSTYADALEKLIGPDGRIHTTYNQMGAATGRLSSNDPNLQNIPIRTELGRSIRAAFTAAPGYRLLSCDYSQIELRVLAHMCGEPALVQAFQRHEDVHTATAQLMFKLGDSKPDKTQRNYAKLLNYAVLYGVTGFGLAQQLGGGFSRAEAQKLIDLYNERFPTVRDFMKSVVESARSKGFTTTLYGRRRYFPDIHAAKVTERQYAERQAMNAPIQGTAADMLKLAMQRAHAVVKGSGSRMLLNVHDELVFELKDGEEHLIEPIRASMESALPLSVPVEVDAKIGHDWLTMSAIPRA
jgi:DNA polymerase-1